MTLENLVNKKGEVQKDRRQKPLKLGQFVLVFDTVYSKGGRGSVSVGVVIGFNRYVFVLKDTTSQYEIDKHISYFKDVANKVIKDTHQEREKFGINETYRSIENVSPQYLIGCSKDFILGWVDGSIFE